MSLRDVGELDVGIGVAVARRDEFAAEALLGLGDLFALGADLVKDA